MKKILLFLFSIILVGSLIIGNSFNDNVDLLNKDKVSSDVNVDVSPGLITFTIEKFNFIFVAENGMTWQEWVVSEYNYINGIYSFFEFFDDNLVHTYSNLVVDVLPSDVIEDGVHYLVK